MHNNKREIIAAIASPPGRGAVSIIRISGGGSADIVKKLTGRSEFKHGQMVPCRFSGRINDRIMAAVFYGTKSYTGEESAELYFHGGSYLTEQALLSVIDCGARLAEAGEFTRRAFLNGKIDLTMAEGISDLIDGDSIAAVNSAYEQSEGSVKQAIESIYGKVAACAANAEVCIDYPEEDIEEQTREQLNLSLKEIIKEVDCELDGYNGGRIVREGARIVLTGEVNAGKSTLFNTLLGYGRAIVSSEEGTTRDTVEEKLVYKGIAFVLIDTAGVRETSSEAENLGIQRSKTAAESADLVIRVIKEGCQAPKTLDENTVTVVNSFSRADNFYEGALTLNAKTGEGCSNLKELIYNKLSKITGRRGCINNPRHYAALTAAREALNRAAENPLTIDCVCADLREALDSLGSITGKNTGDSIIEEIFSRFCVGK